MSPVAHVVVFSELSPRARAQYTRFLLENNVQFAKRRSDGRYIANVRLQAPFVVHGERPASSHSPRRLGNRPASSSPSRPDIEIAHANKADDVDNSDDRAESDDGREESASDSSGRGHSDESIPLRFRPFAAFIREVGSRMLSLSCMNTYVTSESKLLRLISEIYDAYAADTLSSVSDDLPPPTSFSSFVRAYLKSRFGLRSLVEQQALELLEGLDAHRARLDVEHFSLFLGGHYEASTLVFYLKARDAVQEAVASAVAMFRPTSAASARRRRSEMDSTNRRQRRVSKTATALVWLSKRQIESAAQQTFGSKNDDAYLQFAHQIRSYLATRGTPRTMQELLEVHEFLSLALRTFLELKHSPMPKRSGSLSSATSGHQAHDDQDTVDMSLSPSPLPPPPLPRACGATVRMALAAPTSLPTGVTGPAGHPGQPLVRPAPVQPYRPAPEAIQSDGNTRKPLGDAVDDVQARLSSLMARMQQRRQPGQ